MSIWWFAFGYFACYVPYSALTKAITQGMLGTAPPPSGFELLPITVIASTLGMFALITLMGWWRYASRSEILGRDIPHPGRWTFFSGLCTAAIIVTTTLAYSFSGVSIVFMMLIMRGGLLILAPVVDALSGRSTRWFSWAGLLLSLGALLVAFSDKEGYELTVVSAVDVTVYLASYFVRLRLMSNLAKSEDPEDSWRYFVEEQIVASPAVLVVLALLALGDVGAVGHALRAGFTDIWGKDILPHACAVGLLSQGTGVFGGLILLSKQENTFCVPVNRSSSIMAGVVASLALALLYDNPMPSNAQLIGAGLIVGAIFFLTLPPMIERKRAQAARDK